MQLPVCFLSFWYCIFLYVLVLHCSSSCFFSLHVFFYFTHYHFIPLLFSSLFQSFVRRSNCNDRHARDPSHPLIPSISSYPSFVCALIFTYDCANKNPHLFTLSTWQKKEREDSQRSTQQKMNAGCLTLFSLLLLALAFGSGSGRDDIYACIL